MVSLQKMCLDLGLNGADFGPKNDALNPEKT
jgi:hypothetical protein